MDTQSSEALFQCLLRLGDNTLILGHRLGEWCGHAPALEEDIALANTALDLMGQTRHWLTLAGEVIGGPVSKEVPCGTMLIDQANDKHCIVDDGLDLLPVADDALVAHQSLKLFIGIHGDPVRVESLEGFFETRPLVFDHLPRKTGSKDDRCHHGEIAVVRSGPQCIE